MGRRKGIRMLLGASIMFILTACGRVEVAQTADSLTVELGENLEINVSDYFTVSESEALVEFVVDDTKVDINKVGSYDVTVAFEDERYNIVVNVKDTTAPIVTLKELGTYNEGDTIKISDIVSIEELSEYIVAFKTDTVAVEEVTVSEDVKDFVILAKDIHGNISEEIKVTFDVYVDPFKKSPLNPSVQCTYDRGKDFLSSDDDIYTISQEFIDALIEAVPIMADFPKEYQDNILKRFAQLSSMYDTEDEVIKGAERSFDLDEYYQYETNEKYGDVKGYTDPHNGWDLYVKVDDTQAGGSQIQGGSTQITGSNGDLGDTDLTEKQKAQQQFYQDMVNRVASESDTAYETLGYNISKIEVGVYGSVYNYVDEESVEVSFTEDGEKETYTRTRYYDQKAIYTGPYDNEYLVYVLNGRLCAESFIDPEQFSEGGAKLSDHLR